MYPALAVVDALAERDSVVWIGGEGGMEGELVSRAGLPFQAIQAAGIHGVGLPRLAGNLLRLARGYRQSRQLVREIQPHSALFTGGYVGIPVVLTTGGVGRVAFVPDIEPALAMRWITRRVDSVCVTSERSLKCYPAAKRVRVSGYPSRFAGKVPTRDEGRRGLGLATHRPVVLVMGGSRGARSINQALWSVLPELIGRAQVIHLTGRLGWPGVSQVQDQLGRSAGDYHPFDYLHDRMGHALAAADLVLSRAGASVMGDYPHFSLPSLLVPYPHAWKYQVTNAEYMQEQGASIVLRDEHLQEGLLPAIEELLLDGQRLVDMAAACQALARPEAAEVIVEELRRAAQDRQPR